MVKKVLLACMCNDNLKVLQVFCSSKEKIVIKYHKKELARTFHFSMTDLPATSQEERQGKDTMLPVVSSNVFCLGHNAACCITIKHVFCLDLDPLMLFWFSPPSFFSI